MAPAFIASTAKGTSHKGAVGVVAMVDRKAMSKKGGVWDLDGSMAGGACSEALHAAVADVSGQLHDSLKRLTPDAADRLLRPKTRRGAR